MTARHPQTSVEYMQKLYRDHRAGLLAPPVFPPAETPAQAVEQQAEMDEWQLQERYGKPLDPYWYKASFVLSCGAAVAGIGVLLLSLRSTYAAESASCFPDETSCFETAASMAADGVAFEHEFGLCLLTLAALAFGLFWFLRIGSRPERFYGSAAVRAGVGVFRFVGMVVATMWILNKIDPPRHSPRPDPMDPYGYTKRTQWNPAPVKVQVVDSQGFNVPMGTPGSTFRPF